MTTRIMPLLALIWIAMAGIDTAATATKNSSSSSTSGDVVASTLCDSQLLFQKLYVLMPAINQCATESDYFIKPSNLTMPSDASLAKFCKSKNCSQLSIELDNAGLPSCTVPVGNTTMPFKVFFKDIKSHCDSTTGSGAPSSTTSAARQVATMKSVAVAIAVIAFVTALLH